MPPEGKAARSCWRATDMCAPIAGVPWYVRRMAPQMQVMAVMLLEVEDGPADPETYLPRAPDGKVAADYVLFTPRHERPDPCEKMRDQF